MQYFVDTNVPIGYTVPHDKWHAQSINFLNKTSAPIFWSNLVQKEYFDTLNSIVDNMEIFLDEIEKILKENEKDFNNYFRFERFILQKTKHCKLDKTKKIKILEDFWAMNNIIEGPAKEVYVKFTDFIENLNKIYFKRDSDLRNILILHDCGIDNYLKYYNYALKLYKNGVHKPDCKIIIDAHDCGLNHENLIFISNDNKMLESINSQDTSYLKIFEFKSCN